MTIKVSEERMFDKNEAFEKEIMPLMRQARDIAEKHGIPFFATAVHSLEGQKNEEGNIATIKANIHSTWNGDAPYVPMELVIMRSIVVRNMDDAVELLNSFKMLRMLVGSNQSVPRELVCDLHETFGEGTAVGVIGESPDMNDEPITDDLGGTH